MPRFVEERTPVLPKLFHSLQQHTHFKHSTKTKRRTFIYVSVKWDGEGGGIRMLLLCAREIDKKRVREMYERGRKKDRGIGGRKRQLVTERDR